MFEFADALIDGDAGSALTQIDQVMRRGSDPQVFIRDTVAHLRGILLAGAVGEGLAELLEITPEDAARFAEQSKKIGPEALNRMLELFMRAEPDTKWASRPRTILELAAVRACHPEKEPDATVQERLERVEKLIESGAAARPARRPPPGPPRSRKSPRKGRAQARAHPCRGAAPGIPGRAGQAPGGEPLHPRPAGLHAVHPLRRAQSRRRVQQEEHDAHEAAGAQEGPHRGRPCPTPSAHPLPSP